MPLLAKEMLLVLCITVMGKTMVKLRHATVLEVFADGILAQEQNDSHPKHFKDDEA